MGRDLLRSADPSIAASNVPGEAAWVVAVGGDLRCSFCISSPPPLHSGLYLLNAQTGDLFSAWACADFWPSGFDALPDDSLAANSVTTYAQVVGIREPDLLL